MTTGERENGAPARGPRTTVATGRGKGGSSLFNNQMFLVAVFTALRAVVGGVALIVDEGIIDDRRKGQTVSRVRRQFWAVTSPLTSNEFKRCFRMSRESFKNLVEMVRGRNRSSSGPVTPEECLAITVRLLAGASYLDLMLVFGIAKCTVYHSFHRTLDVLSDVLALDGILSSEEELRKLAIDFKNSRNPPNRYQDVSAQWMALRSRSASRKTNTTRATFIVVRTSIHYPYRLS